MAFKVENSVKGVKGSLELNEEKYTYTAYPVTSDVMKLMIKAQRDEDELASIGALDKYFEECIEFDKKGFKNPKEEVRKALDRAGKLYEFINYVIEEVGKQTQAAQKD